MILHNMYAADVMCKVNDKLHTKLKSASIKSGWQYTRMTMFFSTNVINVKNIIINIFHTNSHLFSKLK